MNLRFILFMGMTGLLIALLAGCGNAKVVVSEPVVITTPGYLLEPITVPSPMDKNTYLALSDQEQKSALSGLSRQLYAVIDLLAQRLIKIKDYQEAALRGPQDAR